MALEDEVSEHDYVLHLTDYQTAGRGRFDRKWEPTKNGASLLSTWSFAVNDPPAPQATIRIGLGLITALQATWPFLNFELKAPNDVLIDGNKLAGLLVETVSQGTQHRLLIGLGINVLAGPSGLIGTTNLLAELAKNKSPFIGDDWMLFCERLFFELCAALSEINGEFNETTKKSILLYLNKGRSATESFTDFDSVIEEMDL
jgi:BirA family biotin operon repressor/biotin-[acetyl-CoA-carboxylase] ligase